MIGQQRSVSAPAPAGPKAHWSPREKDAGDKALCQQKLGSHEEPELRCPSFSWASPSLSVSQTTLLPVSMVSLRILLAAAAGGQAPILTRARSLQAAFPLLLPLLATSSSQRQFGSAQLIVSLWAVGYDVLSGRRRLF